MTKIQNRQQAQTNMKTLLVWEPWNSQGFIPQTQWKASCSSIKWSCVNNIIMRPNPANAWLYMLRSRCTLLVVVRSVPPATTRRLGRCPGSGGLGLPTATGHCSEPRWQRCSARLEMRPRHKKSEWWMLNLPEKSIFGKQRSALAFIILQETIIFDSSVLEYSCTIMKYNLPIAWSQGLAYSKMLLSWMLWSCKPQQSHILTS